MSRFFRPDRTRLPTYTKPRPDPLFHSYVPSLRFPVRPKRLTGRRRPGRRLAERAAELEVVATGLAGGRTDARRGWAGGRAGKRAGEFAAAGGRAGERAGGDRKSVV